MLLDKDGRIFCYRTPQIPFLIDCQEEFHAAVIALTGPDKDNPYVISKFASQIRGPHFPLIMGHARQFQEVCFSIYLHGAAPSDAGLAAP